MWPSSVLTPGDRTVSQGPVLMGLAFWWNMYHKTHDVFLILLDKSKIDLIKKINDTTFFISE